MVINLSVEYDLKIFTHSESCTTNWLQKSGTMQ